MKLSNRCHCAVLLLAGAFNQGIVPPAKVTGVSEVGQHQDWYFEAVAGTECTLRLKGLDPGFSARLDVFDLQSGVSLSDAGWTKAGSDSAVSTGALLLESSGRFGVRVTGLEGVGSYAVSHRLVWPKAKQPGSLVPAAGTPSDLQLDLHALAGWRLDLRLKCIADPVGVVGLTLLHPGGLEEDLLGSCKLKLPPFKAALLTLHGHPLPESGTYSLLVHGNPALVDSPFLDPPQLQLTSWLRAPKPHKGVVAAGSYQTVLYVDDDARGVGDGTDWPDAFPDLQFALDRAREILANPLLDVHAPAGPTLIELRVAGGTYCPDGGTLDRTRVFDVPRGVALRGGYAGLAGSGGDERDITAFPTTLSGDLLGDDAPGFQFREDNARTVVVSADGYFAPPDPPVLPSGSAVIIDGVTVRGAHWTPLDAIPLGAFFVDRPRVVIRDCDVLENSGSTAGSYFIPGVVRLQGVIVLVNTRIRNNLIGLQAPAFLSQSGSLTGGAASLIADDGLLSVMRHCEITENLVQMDTALDGPQLHGFAVWGSALHASGHLLIAASTIAGNQLSALATKPSSMGAIEVHGVGACVEGNISLVACDIRGNSLDVALDSPPVGGSGIGFCGFLMDSGLQGGGRVQGCRITGNRHQTAKTSSGASMSGGGLAGYVPHLVDTLVAGNEAPRFAGVDFQLEDSEILGCTIVGNTSTTSSGASYIEGGRVANSLLAGNLSLDPPGPAADLVPGLVWPVEFDHSIIGADLSALVVDPVGRDGLVGTGDESWQPLPGSALIDTGWYESYEDLFNQLGVPAVAGRPLRDAAGAARFQVSLQQFSQAMPDIGAFEAPP